jgi:hypothetical protein
MRLSFDHRTVSLAAAAVLLALAALACNFPGSGAAQLEVTKTLLALATQTEVAGSTLQAGNNILFMTQTAAIRPSITPTVQVTNTATATATTKAGDPTQTPAGSPTQTSIANETLKVGIEALISTGDVPLNMRSDPGSKGSVVARLPGDTRVSITGGPVAADGVLWWQVTVLTTSGDAAKKSGWCAEQASGRQTLVAAK